MKTLTIFLGLFLMTLNVQSQNVITVDNRANTGADYTSLATAVSNATFNDIIQIHPSAVSYGNATITIPLTLVGLSHNPANSKSGEKAIVGTITFTSSSAGSLVTGLQVGTINTSSQIDVTGIKIVNNRISNRVIGSNTALVNNWVIEGNIFTNGYVHTGGVNVNGWMVKNNIFDTNNNYPIQAANDQTSFLNNIVISSTGNFANACTDTIVSNNIFILEGSIADVILLNSTVVFSNNMTRNTTGFPVTPLSGTGNYDGVNPEFSFSFANIADYYNNDYNVTNASALNGGTDGTDLGVFGALFTFDVQGRPDSWPYMTSLNISNPSVPMGQNIDVTFTAEKKN